MKYILYSLIFLLTACGSLPKDTSPAPIDNNFYTVEMASCGQRNTGLLGCAYETTNDLTKLYLEIPLFHKGEYLITSNKCNYNSNQIYTKTQTLKLTFAQLLANKSPDQPVCDFDVKVFIEGLDRGFRGIFILSEIDGYIPATVEYWSGQKLAAFSGVGGVQLRAGSDKSQYLKFITDKPGTLVWFGCDIEGEKEYESNPQLSLSEVFSGGLIADKSCILEAGFKPHNGKSELFTFNIQIFNNNLVQLSDPYLSYNNGKLEVVAEPAVALISINSYHKLMKGNKIKKLKRSVPQDKEVWVRIATANGRYNLYKVLNGEIIWKSLIRY